MAKYLQKKLDNVEFFDLQDKGFTPETAGKLVFGEKAEELVDAIILSKA